MKRPSEKEIEEAYDSMFKRYAANNSIINGFKAGIDFVLKYNEEQRDILKIYNIGYDIDLNVIKKIMESDNDLWDEYDPSEFEGITDVGDMGDNLQITFNMRSDYGLHEGLQIDIDDKGRVFAQAGDTPWEGSGFEGEIEQALMTYVTKQKYK